MPAWLVDNGTLLGVLGIIGIVSALVTVACLPAALVRIPADYFVERRRPAPRRNGRQALWRYALLLIRNIVGVMLILAGIAMLVLPGQGLITLLVGLILTSLPGKYALEKWLVARPGVLAAINWLRRRCGHPPVQAPRNPGGRRGTGGPASGD